ncbi:hypothetical protein QNI16_02710 [Cytophagaceae bacterium YF14B1]|uniref:Uncharacterized protein n=1 Tax=Xanthocytophaga flava TaxID=3048013 RepID=A0AAE3QMI8_9BACT|nr:hypothetical protein [Xanthocytophaga flavus]MDJ1479378.1 hypothetical protein [Xanthocytophaga flavus]
MYLPDKAKPLRHSSKYLLDSQGKIDDFIHDQFLAHQTGGWNRLLKRYAVSALFLDKYASSYFGTDQYQILLAYQNLSSEYIEKALQAINAKVWRSISVNQSLSDDFVRKYQNDIDWNSLSSLSLGNLSMETIREFEGKINWCQIVMSKELTRDFFREFKDKISWNCVHERYLTLDFICEFQDYVNWTAVSSQADLPMDFVEEFAHRVHWKIISESQVLSEEFIRKYQDQVSWNHIFIYQKLSQAFIDEFSDHVNASFVADAKKTSKDFEKRYGKRQKKNDLG